MAPGNRDVSTDYLDYAGISVKQHRKGYRFSIDSLLLADFALKEKIRGRVLEGGAGSGVVSLLLGRLSARVEHIVGVEVQEDLARLAELNVSENNLSKIVEIVCGDLREAAEKYSRSIDSFISNPPFRAVMAGRISPDQEKRNSKSEFYLDIPSLGEIISTVLSRRGVFFIVYTANRAHDLISIFQKKGLKVVKAKYVHSFPHSEAELVLLKGTLGAQKEIRTMPPLIIYERVGCYSLEMRKMFRGMEEK